MRPAILTERLFAQLVEEYKIGLAYWPRERFWTAGVIEPLPSGGRYHEERARTALAAVEALSLKRGWIDRDGNPIN